MGDDTPKISRQIVVKGTAEDRAAPPRDRVAYEEGLFLTFVCVCPSCRPGGDLLSRALRRSTIGPEELNDRVRNGIGWGLLGIATRSARGTNSRLRRHSILLDFWLRPLRLAEVRAAWILLRNDQADRAISTG